MQTKLLHLRRYPAASIRKHLYSLNDETSLKTLETEFTAQYAGLQEEYAHDYDTQEEVELRMAYQSKEKMDGKHVVLL